MSENMIKGLMRYYLHVKQDSKTEDTQLQDNMKMNKISINIICGINQQYKFELNVFSKSNYKVIL